VVLALERIKEAIILGNTAAFQDLYDWVRSRGLTNSELDNGQNFEKFVTGHTLIYAMQSLNWNNLKFTPVINSIMPGSSRTIGITASNMLENKLLFWSVDHKGTSSGDFVANSGMVTMVNNQGSMTITAAMNNQNGIGKFDLVFRSGSITGPIVYRMKNISMLSEQNVTGNKVIDLLTACCWQRPGIIRDAKSFYYLGGE
jgi:hypothetical protein